jgi:MFS superfamily sulfate permease-like transporter/carbonic anhydrase/acetyltransferase-like protein (isoleucine patch superfamily)
MGLAKRLKYYLTPNDGRFEDLAHDNVILNVFRDAMAGLVVAMIAIPLAMGMAIASGLRPEQGIVGGAVAGLVGALFGGSKYQVYGPTAAFIPIIAAIMAQYDHGFLVAASLLAAVVLWVMSFTGMGRHVRMVPHSIIVGFTIGIAVTIALSQLGEMFGLHVKLGYDFIEKMKGVYEHFGTLEIEAVALTVGTLLLTKFLARVSPFLPAPLLALGLGVMLTQTIMSDGGLPLVGTKYGEIPALAVIFTPPHLPETSPSVIYDLIYAATAIVFVAAIESLLCSRMADRLANNTRRPFDPEKELWGQGHVMAIVPLLNGFPHTGALARTATNIKLGAISPLAGIFKAVFKLLIAFYLASFLGLIPMACIAGILLYVAMNMVKKGEIDEVLEQGRGHVWLMIYTAIAVIMTDFLRGVLSALVIYAIWEIVKRLRGKHETHIFPHPHSKERWYATRQSKESGANVWAMNIAQAGSFHRTAFVHPNATVIGRVILGPHVHIAASASVRADEGSPFFIGANSNIQDGAVIHALKDRYVNVQSQRWAVHIGERVSVAHQALVHGPCAIGDDCFIGFQSVIHDSVLGPGCYVGVAATVVGVNVPPGRFVAHGAVVQTQSEADDLPPASEAHRHFNDDVVDVNRGLARAYRASDVEPRIPLLAASEGAGWESSMPQLDKF